MDKPKILKLKCPNPQCGADIKGHHPGKTGVFKIACPKCGEHLKMEVSGADLSNVKLTPYTTDGINVGAAKVKAQEIDGDFYVNEKYEIECPHCHEATIELLSPKAGKAKKSCPKCGNLVILDFKAHTYVAQFNETTTGTPKLKLTYQIKGFLHTRKLEFPLSEGCYVVGRKDPNVPCEIAVTNDPTMSRRSVEITCMRLISGYSYRLKVLKATNPVIINGIELGINAVVSLQAGDSFKLGKTIFKLEKA